MKFVQVFYHGAIQASRDNDSQDFGKCHRDVKYHW